MESLVIPVETVTPLLLGGAYLGGEPELRPPSLRGALRFWFRAILGASLGNDLQRIARAESEIFGSTQQAGLLIVRMRVDGKLEAKQFSLFLHSKPEAKSKGFPPGQRFEICLISPYSSALEQAKKALQLLSYVGGLGRRSRRGFGSIQIVDSPMSIQASQPDNLAEVLQQRLQEILPNKSPQLSLVPKFPCLHPQWSQVRVCCQKFNKWEEAISYVMQKAHEYKNPALGWAPLQTDAGRQASPVHFHVAKLASEGYALVLTIMLSEINPSLQTQANRKKLVQFLACFEGDKVWGFRDVPERWPTDKT
jgi:CRISPR-associated protein Cmr1